MYSLLVTARAGAWDSRSYEFNADRFLQYTEASIKQELHPLSPDAIVRLQQIPALFMYEGRTADVRVGYIRHVSDRRAAYPPRVAIEFDFEWNIAPIPFARLEPLRVALDLGNVDEFATTHWAIKNADLFRILASAGISSAQRNTHEQARPLAASPRGATLAREAELELTLAALRRLGEGGLRALITRRRGRTGLTVADEYDLQDAVEVLLRSLYMDVRPEEPTPSSGGSSSRIDLHVRTHQLAVEVKVTADGRGERVIKEEILRDIHDYGGHPYVRTLVVAIYDFGSTFRNPTGFENDLSGRYNELEVIVLVIPWTGPR